jgi:hypothetical protein
MKDSPLPPQPAALEKLRSRTATLQMVTPPAQSVPAGMSSVSGKRFTIKDNEASIRTVSFSFDQDSTYFRLWDGDGEHQIVCGNGAWKRNEAQMPVMQPSMQEILFNKKVQAPVKLAAHGYWKDSQTFIMTWQYLETPHSNTVTCVFQGDDLQMDVTTSVADPNNPFLMGKENRFTGTLDR